MTSSKKQSEVLALIMAKALKRSEKGYFYYNIPTTTRRSGKMKVSASTINRLIIDGFITLDDNGTPKIKTI